MNSIAALKTVNDDFQVEYEILSPIDISTLADPQRQEVALALQDVDAQISLCEEEISKLSVEIDRLTNHADGIDYAVAVASGILTGLLDSIFVGEMDIQSATQDAEKKIAEKVKEKALKEKQQDTVKKAIENAKRKGKTLTKAQIEEIKNGVKRDFYSNPNQVCGDGQDPVLRRAIRYLEKQHPVPQDNLFHGTGSRPETHHLDDIAHHASLAGMIASIVVQFLRVATFVNKDGKWTLKFVKTDAKELLEIWMPVIISGLLNWLVSIADKHLNTEDEERLPKPVVEIAHLLASTPAIIQIIKTIDNWCLHLYSDVAGSASSKGRGSGIPGLFISLLKEISSIPPLNFTWLPQAVEYLYSTLKIDLRTEIGIASELGKQVVPVLLNEVLVRTFYFVRHLICEYKKDNSFDGIDWKNVIPIGNRTIERMMTIASGTFTAFDIADAAIRSGGFNAACLLRVNFVGFGRFAIALGTDVAMGVKRKHLLNKRIQVMGQELTLLNAKVYYKCAEIYFAEEDMFKAEETMWLAAQDAEHALREVYAIAEESVVVIRDSMLSIRNDMEQISSYRDAIEAHNPGLTKDISNIMKWGKK